MAWMTGDGSIQTIPEIAEAHSSKLNNLDFGRMSPKVAITYTNIGDIQMGAWDKNNVSGYEGTIETDFKSYAGDIVDLSNKVVAEDQAAAKGFN